MPERLILVTCDDGILSPGLSAAVEALAELGRRVVLAPKEQFSGASRSFSMRARSLTESDRFGPEVRAYSLEGSPSQCVAWGVAVLLERKPDLLVSGINYGENIGSGITISGTVGAVLEGASYGIPSLAVSLELEEKYHRSHSLEVDFRVAGHFCRLFGQVLLDVGLPPGVDALKVDVPLGATSDSPWRITRVSRHLHFHSVLAVDPETQEEYLGYERRLDLDAVEPDSDIYALLVDREVSVSPLTIDLTARVDRAILASRMETAIADA